MAKTHTCRNCTKKYNPLASQSWYKGYCTQRCMKEKAKKLGWKESKDPNGRSPLDVLERAKEVGYLPGEKNIA